MAKRKVKTHAINHYFHVLKRIRKALGDDLIVSMALDTDHDGKPIYIVGVATVRSKTQRFNHDREQQTAVLSHADLEDDADKVVDALVQLYKSILIPKTDEGKLVEGVDYKFDITLRDKDGNILQ